jgi:polysaccharide pyruvyl transferase WcaK-like protein
VPQYSRLVVERTRVRISSRPALAVLSGVGDANFGDEWMFEALEQGMPGCNLVPLELPKTEARLGNIGLSGPAFFSGLIVGGGTLVNRYFLERAKPLLVSGAPAWMIGSGVGSAGFGVPEGTADSESWMPYLPSFRRVTVRGPRSAHRLAGADAQVIGDLALFHTPDLPQSIAGRHLAFVNISGTDSEAAIGGIAEDRVISSAAGAVRRLRDAGWRCAPLVVHRDDRPRLLTLGKLIGGWDEPTVHVRDGRDAAQAMASAGALVAMRLHATALGWMHGVPTVALAYRDKTLDLAEHLGASAGVVDLRVGDPGVIYRAVESIQRADSTAERAIHAKALESRSSIRALLRTVEGEVVANCSASPSRGVPNGPRVL